MKNSKIKAGICVGAALGAGAALYAAGRIKTADVCMIAHKGYSGKYPENTDTAFTGAALNGSGGIETDVRVTKDGIFVCNHNATVRFKDGTELDVASSTYDELTAQPLLNDKTDDDVYLCTFRRYLEICREHRLICFIELKGEYDEEQISACFRLAEEVYDLSMCILQSFEFDNLVKAHEMFPMLKIMLTWGKGCGDYRRCFDYGFDIDASYRSLSKKLIRDFHKRGLKVACWTVNSKHVLRYCRMLGVDYIESDYFGG